MPAFDIDVHDVTNAEYQEFVDAGGYRDPRWWSAEARAWLAADRVRHPLFWERHEDRWYWRGMFDLLPLPAAWPVFQAFAP